MTLPSTPASIPTLPDTEMLLALDTDPKAVTACSASGTLGGCVVAQLG